MFWRICSFTFYIFEQSPLHRKVGTKLKQTGNIWKCRKVLMVVTSFPRSCQKIRVECYAIKGDGLQNRVKSIDTLSFLLYFFNSMHKHDWLTLCNFWQVVDTLHPILYFPAELMQKFFRVVCLVQENVSTLDFNNIIATWSFRRISHRMPRNKDIGNALVTIFFA